MLCIVFTLAFDSSPVKGEGLLVGVGLLSPLPCGFWIKSRMTMLGHRAPSTLWIDELLITLCQRVRL